MSNEGLILDSVRRTLAIESAALSALAAEPPSTLPAVVDLLHACSGRVIVTGVGKSALVARKIAATFSSTGTPAAFLHAADALHGDLGMLTVGDVVLCLSKSGETAELRALLPMLRDLGHATVALVARPDSFLARQATVALVTPILTEADTHDLAPTTSAIIHMALGDALASALADLRAFSPADFARFHPGGALGRRLTLTLADLACRNARPQVLAEAALQDVIVEMTGKRLGATVVVDEEQRVIGLITDGDLRRAIGQCPGILRLSAKQKASKTRPLPPSGTGLTRLISCQ